MARVQVWGFAKLEYLDVPFMQSITATILSRGCINGFNAQNLANTVCDASGTSKACLLLCEAAKLWAAAAACSESCRLLLLPALVAHAWDRYALAMSPFRVRQGHG